MDDPRIAKDPNLRAALKAWDNASPFRDNVYDDAMLIRTALRDTDSHRAYAWAALTCGRIAAHRQQVELAEILLTESLGRFYLVNDKYGEAMTISQLALPHISRRNLDRALELALKPLSSEICFSKEDKVLLHNTAMQCYWAQEEPHPAILHAMKAYELVRGTNDSRRQYTILGNIGVVLEVLGEWDLALTASIEAWRLALASAADEKELPLPILSNIVLIQTHTEKHAAALKNAELLLGYLQSATVPASLSPYLNIADAFAFNGQVERAEQCLDRADSLKERIVATPHTDATCRVSRAILFEAKKDFRSAIALALEVLAQPVTVVMNSNRRYAARVLYRSYSALGRKGEAEKWKQFARQEGRERLLSDILSNQIRQNLNVEHPAQPLSPQELTCLSLSAHGQTSADIALKLGIKTRTVNFHFSKVLRKLNAMNRQEAIAKAVSANLLREP